jgi:hypothetical protein
MPDKSLRKDYYKTSGIVSFYVVATNSFSVGQCVRIDNTGTWVLAVADSVENLAQGIVIERDSTSFTVAVSGPIVLSTVQWDAVAGTSGGLTPGAKYYLSASTAGTITNIEPGTSQTILQAVTSTTALLLGFITAGIVEDSNITPTNPISLNLNNTNTTINLANYSTSSFRITNPAQITLTNGVNGVTYTFVITSDGAYSFSGIEFPYGQTIPNVSASGQTDIYTIHCIVNGGTTRYIANFGLGPQNPVTLNLANTNSTINLANYATTSFRITNPAQITLSNGIDGMWYTLAIKSDGTYSFTSEVRFPLGNIQPAPSASGSIDVYTLQCIKIGATTKFIATFAFGFDELF